METTIFGFKINPGRRRVAYTNSIARLFLCDSIDFEYAKELITKLSTGENTLADIDLLTDAYDCFGPLDEFSGSDLVVRSKHKLTEWFIKAGEPSEQDYEVLRKKFKIAVGPIRAFAKKVMRENIGSARRLAGEVKRFIKGQDEAIDRMAVNFFLHLESVRTGKSNPIKTPVLLMGPTGVGKSEIYRRFGQFCNCPVVRINSNEIVPTSWRGIHITDVLARHISDSCPVEKLRHAIIVFHEFDKIAAYGQNKVGVASSDIVVDMMRDMMRLFETGHSLTLENQMTQTTYELPVDDLMIVFDGAFYGLDKIIAKRLNVNRGIGFGTKAEQSTDSASLMRQACADDLIKWGFMPELIGRIGEICVLNPLTPDVIYDIMTTAEENVLSAHIDYCRSHNISLQFNDAALRVIADRAHKSGLGFRNVKTLLARCMNSLYFDLDSSIDLTTGTKTITINKDFITRQLDRNQ